MTTFATTMVVVFLAELGDKTQLVALGFGARQRLRSVVAGVTLAYLATTTLSVIVGGALGAAFPTRVINVIGGLLFIGFAIATLRQSDQQVEHDESSQPSVRSIVATIAIAMFIAELGDKTMIATATLAARADVWLVAAGSLVGITAAGLVGVAIGRAIGARLPERAIRLGSAALFALFGITLLITAI